MKFRSLVRGRHLLSGLAAGVSLGWLSGCAVTHPAGYEVLSKNDAVELQATPGEMYGMAPHSWDLPDGRRVLVKAQRASVTSGPGLYHAEMAYKVSFAGQSEGWHLECATEPSGAGGPSSRFGCWSSLGASEVSFWMAPGQDCPARHIGAMQTLTTQACWSGELTIASTKYHIEYAWSDTLNVPVARVSWTEVGGAAVQGADLVGELSIDLFLPPGGLDEEAMALLTLHAVALHYWEHASRP